MLTLTKRGKEDFHPLVDVKLLEIVPVQEVSREPKLFQEIHQLWKGKQCNYTCK